MPIRILLLSIFMLSCTLCSAQGQIFQIGNENNFVAGVTTERFQFHSSRQESEVWCWAACIQMVLAYQGLYVDQCEIVKEALGKPKCVEEAANCATIMNGAGGWYIKGKPIRAHMEYSIPSAHAIINDLAFKYPLIIGLDMPGQQVGHAYVLTAVFYQYNRKSEKIPYKVVLRDPWPSNPSRTELGWNDFISRINCVTHVTF